MIAVMLLCNIFPWPTFYFRSWDRYRGFHCSQSWVLPCQLELTGKARAISGPVILYTLLIRVNQEELLAWLVKAGGGIQRALNSMGLMRKFGDWPSSRAIDACYLQFGTFKLMLQLKIDSTERVWRSYIGAKLILTLTRLNVFIV